MALVDRVKQDITDMDTMMNQHFWSIEGAPEAVLYNYFRWNHILKVLLYIGFLSIIVLCYGSVHFRIHPEWPMISRNNRRLLVIFLAAFIIQTMAAYGIVFIYSFMFFYACIHGHIQMALLTEYLKQTSARTKCMEEKRLNAFIKHRLVVIVKQHLKLSRYVVKGYND